MKFFGLWQCAGGTRDKVTGVHQRRIGHSHQLRKRIGFVTIAVRMGIACFSSISSNSGLGFIPLAFRAGYDVSNVLAAPAAKEVPLLPQPIAA